jgi:glycosyltransferase involved in cell wall biosynthesis
MFPWMGEYKNKIMDLLSRSKNVVHHGRISQDKLAQEMRQSGIWLYPTNFLETYCITAIEAQLAGLWPITNDLAALKETVHSGSLLPVEMTDEAIVEYVQATVSAMNGDITEETRRAVKNQAPAFTWDQVAASWESRWLG